MAVMAECPICRKKQSVKNKRCTCGEDLKRTSLVPARGLTREKVRGL